MAKRFYTITNVADAEATLSIFDEIGFWGTNAADFRRDLESVTAPVINLQINSPGGSVFDGVAIYNLLKASGKTIKAKVMGVAASIASVILMAADEIDMPANTMLMVHAPSGGVYGTAGEMRDMADVLDKVQASLVATYVKRTGKTSEDISALLAKDTWLTADEAKGMGFADTVSDAIELTAKFDVTDEDLPVAARAAFKAAADKRAADAAIAAAAAAEPDVANAMSELGEAVVVLAGMVAGTTPCATDNAAEALEEVNAAMTYLSGGTPAPSEDDEGNEPTNVAPFAEQVSALVKGTGFEALAAAWAVKYTKPDEVTARITECVEITALYKLANKADKVDAVINAGTSLADARIELQNALAADDKHIDTSRAEGAPVTAKLPSARDIYAKRAERNTNSNQPTQGPSAGKTADVWAKRNK